MLKMDDKEISFAIRMVSDDLGKKFNYTGPTLFYRTDTSKHC